MWLSLPLTAIRYWQVWDRLPAYMATHFSAANQPNGWMTRETSLWFALGLTAFLLTIFSVVLFAVNSNRNEPGIFSWALVTFFCLIVGIVYSVNSGIVDFALYAKPIVLGPVLVTVPMAIVVLIALFLVSERGAPLPSDEVVAVETNAAPVAGVILLAAIVVELWIVVTVSIAAVRFAAVVTGVILLTTCGLAWSGFQYYFTRHGVEVRALGFRLRSIPLGEIREYAVRPWSPIRGYGIRGLGSRRAYVWGRQGVLIKTQSGEVYLGHDHPEQIVRDLDAMTEVVKA